MAKDYWTTKHEDGWQVKGAGNKKATSIHAKQSDAWKETKDRQGNLKARPIFRAAIAKFENEILMATTQRRPKVDRNKFITI